MKTRLTLPLLCLSLAALAAEPSVPASGVRLTILGDNSAARPDVKAVWGFSCLVEARGHTILFDTGADPAALKENLAVLKIDPARIDAVVISHIHRDHTRGAPGLGALPGVRAYTPHTFADGLKETAALRAAGLQLVPVTTATPLFDGITISEPLRFEKADAMDDTWEQCLSIDTPEGLVVVVGCSHPGILPMLEQVKQQTGRPLYLVIGGFHLMGHRPTEVRRVATAMQTLGVAHVSATHCTGTVASHIFRTVFGDRYVDAGVGTVISLPFVPRTP